MIRYKLNENEIRINIFDENDKIIYTWNGYSKLYKKQPTFVDIIGETENRFKIKAFLPDGEIIVGYISKEVEDLIVFHKKHELYDGRFNS